MALSEYKRKRHFDETSEPKGLVKKSGGPALRFVVQKHLASHLHYDFRLELDGVLKSWAVPKGPSLDPEVKRLAMMVEDHPYEYRTFEGTIPKGNYGAGDVIVWDDGTYGPTKLSDSSAGKSSSRRSAEDELHRQLKKGHLSFTLQGKKLKGAFGLIRSPHMGDNAWLLIKKDDTFASSRDITKDIGSVLSDRRLPASGKGIVEINAPKSALPRHVKPMLATLVDRPFDGDEWIFEVKWDGYRAVGSWDGQRAQLYSRNGKDFSERYGPVAEALRGLKTPAVVDGEIVMLDQAGKSHFELLQNYQRGAKGQLAYFIFDLIWYDGHDLRGLPLIERKEILEQLMSGDKSGILHYSDHIKSAGKRFFQAADKQGLEGIMAKRASSTYKDGFRSKQWLKVKTHKRQEVVIGGFTEPRGSRKHIGALMIGVYEGDKLIYAGHVGGGIPTEQLQPLRKKLEALERQTSPFDGKPPKPNAPVHWVTPKLLCEVTFTEWTDDGRMRHPVFAGLRSDKDPRQVTRELPAVVQINNSDKISSPKQPKTAKLPVADRIKFTHPDKIFFPDHGYTKGDLLDYYLNISDIMLPYIKDHPCNLLRQPNGIKGQAFFQKDMAGSVSDWVKTVSVYSESNKKDIHYFVCDGLEALAYMVQLGCIEINPWSSRLKTLHKPDWAVVDLDPEGIGFDKVIEVARTVHEICQELDIPSYPKTSGKTGIHIFIPMGAKYNYEQVRQFSEIIVRLVYERLPDFTSLERDPKKRQHKIYLDYLQNRESQTLAAPYSVRPTPEATVSTPLRWKEVNSHLKPTNFTIQNMPARLQKVGDLWQPVIGKGIDLKAALKRAATMYS